MQSSGKRAVGPQRPVAEPTCEREQAAASKQANASAHGVGFKPRRLKSTQRQPRRPEQPMDQEGTGGDRIATDREWRAASDNGNRKPGNPRQHLMAAPDETNRDASTERGNE